MRALTFAILFAVLYWGTVEHGGGNSAADRLNKKLALLALLAAVWCAVWGL